MKKFLKWICIGAFAFSSLFIFNITPARADFFGGDLPLLSQLIAKAIEQIRELQEVIGATQQTASILEDMNRGVKEVLRLAETAHVPLPKQIYDDAKNIDRAADAARRIYGVISNNAPESQRIHYQSGFEGLYISQDSFEYSTFLDRAGENVKASAVLANQASATRLTAETLGVVLHAISHSNRIQAKTLEILSTDRIENATKENARFSSFVESHEALEQDLKSSKTTPLNSFGDNIDVESQSAGSLP